MPRNVRNFWIEGKRSAEAMKRFYIVTVDGDLRDSHAGETQREALDLASLDPGSCYAMWEVDDTDVGSARLAPSQGRGCFLFRRRARLGG